MLKEIVRLRQSVVPDRRKRLLFGGEEFVVARLALLDAFYVGAELVGGLNNSVAALLGLAR